MGSQRREFTPVYKDEAVKLVINTGRQVAVPLVHRTRRRRPRWFSPERGGTLPTGSVPAGSLRRTNVGVRHNGGTAGQPAIDDEDR